nr:DUF2892 domain-containing protein [Oceanisphaera avium]
MGKLDRSVRALVGIVLIALVFVGPHSAWGWLGVLLLTTAVLGFSPFILC